MRAKVVGSDTGHDVECDCEWKSTGWPSKKQAQERARQHDEEHETQQPMPELKDA